MRSFKIWFIVKAEPGLEGLVSMKHIVLGGVVIALSVFSTPLKAQQTPADNQSPSAGLPAREYVPPPLPPAPHQRNRWVDVGGSRTARHHAIKRHHDIAPEPKLHKHEKTRVHEKHSKHARHEAVRDLPQAAPVSKRMVRMCHKLTYKQIMQQSSCRNLMKQDLETAEHGHSHVLHRDSKHHHPSHRAGKNRDADSRHSARHNANPHKDKHHSTKHHPLH